MIQFLLLFASVIYAVNISQCPCSEFIGEFSCSANLSCQWNNQTNYCNNRNDICAFYTEQSHCDLVDGCAWNNNGVCSAFTQCSDYTVANNSEICYSKNSTCLPGQINTDGSITCKKGVFQCPQVQDQLICNNLIQSDGQWCVSVNEKCTTQNITSCSTITNEGICNVLQCDWLKNSSTCAGPICSKLTTENKCYSVRSDILGQANICVWCNNTCVSADISKNSQFCYYFGSGEYYIASSFDAVNRTCPASITQILTIGLLILSLY